jgi:protein SCO1
MYCFNKSWAFNCVLFVAFAMTGLLNAQLNIREPEASKGVTVIYKTGDYIPFDVPFTDHNSNHISLAEYFDGKRPVIVTFNYSNCPSMCTVQLEELAICLGKIDFEMGEDYQVVSISIDPLEQVSRAREFRRRFVRMSGADEDNDGWAVVVGDQKGIKKVADTCGFKYKYLPRRKEYSHAPVAIMCAPDGKIVRYINGLNFEPQTIRRALIESADGKIGSPINLLTASCFAYDEHSGRYTFAAMRVMRWAAGITVFALVCTLVPYWFFAHRSNKERAGDIAADKSKSGKGKVSENKIQIENQ